MQSILVIFQAEKQETESLALAVGLGAVQAGANIRLRHLDPAPSVELAHAGYGTLRTDDLRWAEGVTVILESPHVSGLGELKSAFEGMQGDSHTGQKWVYIFHADPGSDAKRFVEAIFTNGGFQKLGDDRLPVATMEYMTRIGHTLAGKP